MAVMGLNWDRAGERWGGGRSVEEETALAKVQKGSTNSAGSH